ncbi:hypothetical protein V8E54_002994 [Elaphomyces granulatus]
MAPLTANQAQQDTRRVEKIRVVVHTGYALDQSDNHWSIYLLLQDGGSVRANMVTKEYGHPGGYLVWSDLEYDLTNSAIQHWDFPVTQAITVQNVATTIYRNNRHLYHFSGGGSGCRYWVRVILYDLEGEGYVGEGSSEELWVPLQFLYHAGQDPLPINWVEGTFC